MGGVIAVLVAGSHNARKFTRFLPFGLTSPLLRPTVTVRNHYS
jgi:hypothetical protein